MCLSYWATKGAILIHSMRTRLNWPWWGTGVRRVWHTPSSAMWLAESNCQRRASNPLQDGAGQETGTSAQRKREYHLIIKFAHRHFSISDINIIEHPVKRHKMDVSLYPWCPECCTTLMQAIQAFWRRCLKIRCVCQEDSGSACRRGTRMWSVCRCIVTKLMKLMNSVVVISFIPEAHRNT